MIRTTLLAILLILPFCSSAQPILTKCEKYQPNTIATHKMYYPYHVSMGDSGANITWDFSNVTPLNQSIKAINLSYTDTVYDANIYQLYMQGANDTTHFYMKVDTAYTYSSAVNIKNTLGPTIWENGRILSKHNISYLDTLVDTFTIKNSGYGHSIIIADGYGSLILPNKTYHNVLRVKIEEEHFDTMGSTSSYKTITYRWYDTTHTTYLALKSSLADGSYAYMYFLQDEMPLQIAEQSKINFNAGFNQNNLVLSGEFEPEKEYSVRLYNSVGQKVFQSVFSSHNSIVSFPIHSPLSLGLYVVHLTKGDYSTLYTTYRVLYTGR